MQTLTSPAQPSPSLLAPAGLSGGPRRTPDSVATAMSAGIAGGLPAGRLQ